MIWNYKPWWCQPWSIILTGLVVIVGSWFIFLKIWLTLLVSIPIIIWWLYFLILYPRVMAKILKKESSKGSI